MTKKKNYSLQASILDIMYLCNSLFKESVILPLCLYNVVPGIACEEKPNSYNTLLRTLEGNKLKTISKGFRFTSLYEKKRSAAKQLIEEVMLYSNNKCKAHEVSDETQGLGASLQRQSSSATGDNRLWT